MTAGNDGGKNRGKNGGETGGESRGSRKSAKRSASDATGAREGTGDGTGPECDSADGASVDQRIWMTVCAIPPGSIATYGDVAERAGLPGAARRVGTALRRLPPGSEVPWHRVVNASGRSSLPPGRAGEDRQAERLADEGVILGKGGRRVLERYRWS